MWLWWIACAQPPVDAPRCESPERWWPDADADGVGEPTSTYLGCSPPEGWVRTVGPSSLSDTWLWDTGPFGDSGAHSGGASTADTGWGWSTGHTGGTGHTGSTDGTGRPAP